MGERLQSFSMPHQNGALRIIVATEPRSYREALAGVLKSERPGDLVMAATPDELDALLRRWSGSLVVCSEVFPIVAELAGGWVRLGAGDRLEVSGVPQVEAMAHRVGLEALVDAVDAVAKSVAQLQ
jgi:hypothetical protein